LFLRLGEIKPSDEGHLMYHTMAETLADLHNVDPASIRLADYGKHADIEYCRHPEAGFAARHRGHARADQESKVEPCLPLPNMQLESDPD
jgi:hypothetical protein